QAGGGARELPEGPRARSELCVGAFEPRRRTRAGGQSRGGRVSLSEGALGTTHRRDPQWPGIRARPTRPDGRSDRGVPKGDRAQPEVHTGLQQSGRSAGEARKPRRSVGQLSAIARREAERSRVQRTRCGPPPARQERRGRGTVRQGPGPESVSDYPRGALRVACFRRRRGERDLPARHGHAISEALDHRRGRRRHSLPIERTYREWQLSDFGFPISLPGPDFTTCEGCHMPESGISPAYASSFLLNAHTGDLPVHQVTAGSAFTTPAKAFALKKPRRLCVATDRDGNGRSTPHANLLCYQAKPAKGQPRHVPLVALGLVDDFGSHVLDGAADDEVCLPATIAP